MFKRKASERPLHEIDASPATADDPSEPTWFLGNLGKISLTEDVPKLEPTKYQRKNYR